VLTFRPFRALWTALSVSSLGDWLAILALVVLAPDLTSGSAVAKGIAVGGVFVVTLLPALLPRTVAGALAGRLDPRVVLIVTGVVRGLLLVSIPLLPDLAWLYIAQVLASVAAQFGNAAAAVATPGLVPEEKLEQADRFRAAASYATAPVAAVAFSLLALVSEGLGGSITAFRGTHNVDLSLYVAAACCLVSAITIYSLRQSSRQSAQATTRATTEATQATHATQSTELTQVGPGPTPRTSASPWSGLAVGRAVHADGLVRGVLLAFGAAGAVIGVGYPYVSQTLRGGSAGWGMVVAAVFVGLALGTAFGARVTGEFSRHRLFGLTLAAALVPLALAALVPNLVVVVFLAGLTGLLVGAASPVALEIIGPQAGDAARGRVAASFQSALYVIVLLAATVAAFVAVGLTKVLTILNGSGDVRVAHLVYAGAGQNVVLLLAAVIVAVAGIGAYHRMDDRKGVPLWDDLVRAFRGEELRPLLIADGGPGASAPSEPEQPHGLFLAFEGGEGTGKTTQARLIAIWLREQGYDVITTHEPGATKIGMRLRALLLDTAHAGLSSRAEALMYAADRAEHVASVINPALRRGAVVITDRYVDSSLAYQGTGRGLPQPEIAQLNQWATGGRMPDLTILLDMAPEAGLGRRTRSADRLEAEPPEFHNRVRNGFLALARKDPSRYLVIDASRPVDEVSEEIKDRIGDILPDPVPFHAEAATGSFPALTDPGPQAGGQSRAPRPPGGSQVAGGGYPQADDWRVAGPQSGGYPQGGAAQYFTERPVAPAPRSTAPFPVVDPPERGDSR
jgi:dTMP kinase